MPFINPQVQYNANNLTHPARLASTVPSQSAQNQALANPLCRRKAKELNAFDGKSSDWRDYIIHFECVATWIIIEWCFTPLLTVFQSYHGDSSHYSCLFWVSLVLGWGSEVSCPRTLPRKNALLVGMTGIIMNKRTMMVLYRSPDY